MITMAILFYLICGASAGAEAVSIERRYREIILDYKRELAEADKSSPRAKRAIGRVKQRLAELLSDVGAEHGHLASDDLIALSEAAERVGRNEAALSFAEEAAKKATSLRAFLSMVRCLCALDRVEDAEAVARMGVVRFPGSRDEYVLLNVLADKHRAVGNFASAYDYLEPTISLVCEHIDDSAFFAARLRVLLQAASECADRAEANARFETHLEAWRTRLTEILSIRLSREVNTNQAERLNELTKIDWCERALLAVSEFAGDEATEDTVLRRLKTVRRLFDDDCPREHVFLTLKAALDSIPALLTPMLDSTRIANEIENWVERLEGAGISDASQLRAMEGLKGGANSVLELVRQHGRHRDLTGTMLLEANELGAETNDDEGRYFLLHIFSPSARDCGEGLRSVKLALGSNADFSRVRPVFCTVERGLAWDHVARRLYRSQSQGLDGERDAIRAFGYAMGLSEAPLVLPVGSRATRAMGIRYFPVNLLLNNKGKVVGATTGPEILKVTRLLEMTGRAPSVKNVSGSDAAELGQTAAPKK